MHWKGLLRSPLRLLKETEFRCVCFCTCQTPFNCIQLGSHLNQLCVNTAVAPCLSLGVTHSFHFVTLLSSDLLLRKYNYKAWVKLAVLIFSSFLPLRFLITFIHSGTSAGVYCFLWYTLLTLVCVCAYAIFSSIFLLTLFLKVDFKSQQIDDICRAGRISPAVLIFLWRKNVFGN